jgi:hypothetical protein
MNGKRSASDSCRHVAIFVKKGPRESSKYLKSKGNPMGVVAAIPFGKAA